MKVILKSKIKKLGNIGDIVDVKDGYGRNMLIPNGLAIFYTDKNYEVFKIKKAEIERENQEKKAIAEELKDKINSRDLILLENAGDDGKLYGSITTTKLAQALNALVKITTLTKNNVYLKEPLKNVGKYEIIVDLHPEVIFDKEVIIARTKEEAAKIKKGEFEIKKVEKAVETAFVAEENSGESCELTGELKDKAPKKVAKEAKEKKVEEKEEAKEEVKEENEDKKEKKSKGGAKKEKDEVKKEKKSK